MTARPASRRWPPGFWRQELLWLAELCGLYGLAIALPVLSVIGGSPDFLFLEQLTSWDVILLAVGLALLPPIGIWGVSGLTRLAGPRPRQLVHVAAIGGLMVALALQAGKHLTSLRGLPLVAVAVLAGAVGVLAYVRAGWVASLLRMASPTPLLAVVLLLFVSPASVVVMPRHQPTASGRVAGGRHPPIVIVAFDELPLHSLLDISGRVDPDSFPNLAWLAERSTWYRNATGVTTWTRDAYPAMLTGRYPTRGLAAHFSNYPHNLFTTLAGTYQLDVHEVATMLCPPAQCPAKTGKHGPWKAIRRGGKLVGDLVLPWDSPVEPSADLSPPAVKASLAGLTVPTGFPEFLTGLQPSSRPTLHYIHMLLPHRPWKYLPGGLQYPETKRRLGFASANSGWPAGDKVWNRVGLQRHLLQLAYADHLLDMVFQTLQARGLFDQALVVVTADHGISFKPGTHPRVPTKVSLPQIMWVPLFIKAPGQHTGRVDDRNWEHVDLFPTLADYAGVAVPAELDGRSALRGPQRGDTKRFYNGVPEHPGGKPVQILTISGRQGLQGVLRGDLPARPSVQGHLGGRSGQHLWKQGLRPDLVGRSLSRLRVVTDNRSVTVKDLDAFAKVDPASGEIPALVVGEAGPGIHAGAQLAVVLNGQVGVVAEVAPEGADHRLRFAGVLGAELFRPGANHLQILAVQRGRLQQLTVEGN